MVLSTIKTDPLPSPDSPASDPPKGRNSYSISTIILPIVILIVAIFLFVIWQKAKNFLVKSSMVAYLIIAVTIFGIILLPIPTFFAMILPFLLTVVLFDMLKTIISKKVSQLSTPKSIFGKKIQQKLRP